MGASDISGHEREFQVGDRVDIDMYKGAEIIEDLGERVKIQTKKGDSKVVYKSLLYQFAELCNKDGLTTKGMAPYMQHLTIWERKAMNLLQRDGYYITSIGRDYVLMTDLDDEVYKLSKRIVHKLYKNQYIYRRGTHYIINPRKFQ